MKEETISNVCFSNIRTNKEEEISHSAKSTSLLS
jgi:hypothetical protein